MHRLFIPWVLCVLLAATTAAEPPSYLVFVSNERSGDVRSLWTTDSVVGTFLVGKRPRAFTLRPMAGESLLRERLAAYGAGLDENRAPADKRADGLGVIDPSVRKLIDRWH